MSRRLMLKLLAVLIAVLVGVSTVSLGHAGPLENLERERAMMIDAWFDRGHDAEGRAQVFEVARSRLLTLERLVLRDDSLLGRNTPTIRRAFANYDLTFLIHASAESQQAPIDTWFSQVGLTTSTLMTARVGRR